MFKVKYKIYQIHNNGEANNGFLHSFIEDILFSDYESIESANADLNKFGSKHIKYMILPIYEYKNN